MKYAYKQVTLNFSEDNPQEMEIYNFLIACNRKKTKLITSLVTSYLKRTGVKTTTLNKQKVSDLINNLDNESDEKADILQLLLSMAGNKGETPKQKETTTETFNLVKEKLKPNLSNYKPVKKDKDDDLDSIFSNVEIEDDFEDNINEKISEEERQKTLAGLQSFGVF